ncbi:NUDIX hydrolase [Plantactinospora siamensis]|uniref:NUDIX hydrolase n=1 Tax=Plantactinospora siamensis TaxID=555372 RepID=A0ABV6NPM6_9ACTN
MERRRRIGAYGLCRNGDTVLLVRASVATDVPGVWQIPGGGLEHGERPDAALVREFAEETGLTIEPVRPLAAVSDIRLRPDLGIELHLDRIVYEVRSTGGELRAESAGGTDQVRWITPDELVGLPLMPFTAELLGCPVSPLPSAPMRRSGSPLPPPPPGRGQRFGAYGLVTDPAGRVLLTRIAQGYPGAGRWHLPGGGTDHGEQPVTGLLRELVEEADQLGRVTGLLAVDSSHNPTAMGPEGYPMDWHVVRVIYRVVVDVPTDVRVTEATGGSTAGAGWFDPAALPGLPLTGVARMVTTQYLP